MCMFIVQIFEVGSADFTLMTPRDWNSLSQSHLPPENAVQFASSVAIHRIPLFVPPGTLYY